MIDIMNNWIPRIIVALLIIVGCNTTWVEPTYNHWEWAECLPSLGLETNCPGDKPLWQVYKQTGEMGWLYQMDFHYQEGVPVYDITCLNYLLEPSGFTRNIPVNEFPHAYFYNPVLDKINKLDSNGYYQDTVWFPAFYNDSTGRVAPKWWNI